jgi:hypothetical protein
MSSATALVQVALPDHTPHLLFGQPELFELALELQRLIQLAHVVIRLAMEIAQMPQAANSSLPLVRDRWPVRLVDQIFNNAFRLHFYNCCF